MKSKYIRVLQDIQDRIPADLLRQLTKKEKQYPTLKLVIEAALLKPDSEVSPKQKERMQAVLDSGMLAKEVEVIDFDIEKQIAAYFEAEIANAVKLGRLPKKAPSMKLLNNKGKQYARRKERQLRKLASGENNGVVVASPDNSKDEGEHSSRTKDVSVLPIPGQ